MICSYKPLKTISLASVVLIGTSLLGSCRSIESPANASQSTAVSVELAAVKSDTISDSSEFLAQLESRQAVVLQPRVEGQIEQIFVRVGDEVEAGDPIIQIDAREQLASVASQATEIEAAHANVQRARASRQQASANLSHSHASLQNAEATLATLEADRRKASAELRFNEEQYQRFESIYTEGAISSQDLAQYRNGLDVAHAELQAVESRIQAQQAEIESYRASLSAQQAEVTAQEAELAYAERQIQQAQANTEAQEARLGYYTITAPFAGTIGNVPVKVGDFVSTDTQLTKVAQNDSLEVNVSIPINRVPYVGIGTEVEILNAQDHVVETSRIFFIAPNVVDGTQLVLVKARLENSNSELRADEFIRARVIWEQQPGLKIPTTAISRIAGQTFVFAAESSEDGLVARQTPVELGEIEGNYYQVLGGLDSDDQIAVTGLLQLYDGAAIAPES
ncbi:MAG: efflux RND transporter periplasmic adaptor subunit [Leptolyngbya sp. SIO1E4]|nr:efflux RND transporter periplasmic adaptor subunit [Leptolyngbya sp. SIO1E4]